MPLSAQDIIDIRTAADGKCDEIGQPRGTTSNRPTPDPGEPARGHVRVAFGGTIFEIGHFDDQGVERTAAQIMALARAAIHGQFRPGEIITPVAPIRDPRTRDVRR